MFLNRYAQVDVFITPPPPTQKIFFHQIILFQLEYIILRIFLNIYVQIDIFITPKKFLLGHFISVRAKIFN